MKINLPIVVLLNLPIVLLSACQPDSPAAGGPLAPGEVRVLSVEPVGPDSGEVLLPNGAFEEWHGGLPAPTGFTAPADPGLSSVRRDTRSGVLNTPGYTARQTWFASDVLASPREAFHTSLSLAPATRYAFSAVATAAEGVAATVGAWEQQEDGTFRVLSRAVVRVAGTVPERFTGTFTTQAGGTVVLASQVETGSRLPGTVVWSEWRLEPAGEEIAPVSVADLPARRGLIDAVLDQVAAQIALYGGPVSWTRGAAPVISNTRRILQENEARPGEAVLGYDGFVFPKTDLAYVASTMDLSRDDLGVDRPGYHAIVEADRLLAARGIQLVLVPVPERLHLYADMLFRPAADGPLPFYAHALLIDRLVRDDLLALDPAPLLWRMRHEGMPVFWRGDADLPSGTAQALAAWIAPEVRALLTEAAPGKRIAYSVQVDTIPLEQRLVPALMASQRGEVPPETHEVHSVRAPDGALFTPNPESPVLVLGSHALAHQVRGASLAAHLSHQLGFPVAVPSRIVSDGAVPTLLSTGEELTHAKVVVFCFPESVLATAAR
jgi:hypothetical protein